MTNNVDSSKLTFGQREGVDPLPVQLKLREISQSMRAQLWAIIDAYLDESAKNEEFDYTLNSYRLDQKWAGILRSYHIDVLCKMRDEFKNSIKHQKSILKGIFQDGDYIKIFNLIEYFSRDDRIDVYFVRKVNYALEKSRSAYRLVDKSIIAYTSEYEGKAVEQALLASAPSKFSSARSHLVAAGRELGLGNWSDSIRESIHAVESVAVLIDPSSTTLGAAILKLEKAGRINPNFKRGVNALYDYTSDEKGIRHAKIFPNQDNVGETEALFMFGSCSSFVTYLIRKSEEIK